MADTTTPLPPVGSRSWRDLISTESSVTVLSHGASAPACQLLPQSLKRFLLGPLHRHGADLQLRGRLPQRQALKDGEPQGRGLLCRQLIY